MTSKDADDMTVSYFQAELSSRFPPTPYWPPHAQPIVREVDELEEQRAAWRLEQAEQIKRKQAALEWQTAFNALFPRQARPITTKEQA